MLEKTKAHIKDHKELYVGIAIGVAVTSVGVVILRKPPLIVTKIKGNNNTVNNIVISALGDPGNVVQCVETGTVYASQGQAAREMGLNAARVSEHLSGKLPHINGFHLEKLGKAGEPLAK